MRDIPSVISGIVKESNGNPISQARVSFIAGPGPFPDIAALTDSKGTFALSAPIEGEYIIQVVADEFITETVKVTIENNTQKKNIEITLSR
jgi:carboxypeptidase family protein